MRSGFVAKSDRERNVGRTFLQIDEVHLGIDGDDRPQEPEHLVDDMATEVAQKSASRACFERVGISAILIRGSRSDTASSFTKRSRAVINVTISFAS